MKHFDDLTEIDCRFCDLDDDTQARLLLAHRRNPRSIEVNNPGWAWRERFISLEPLQNQSAYRVRPDPLIPDWIDWECFDPKYKSYARDPSGCAFVYEGSLSIDDGEWFADDGNYELIPLMLSEKVYKRGTVNWKDSLLVRPE